MYVAHAPVVLRSRLTLITAELVTELSAITSAPRLETLGNGTWTTLLDGVYINGMLLDGHSEASEAYASEFHHDIPGNATIAAIDTGSSYGTSHLR